MKIGVYAGSFNPLHKGHLNIIKKASKLFDRICIVKMQNMDKVIAQEYLNNFTKHIQIFVLNNDVNCEIVIDVCYTKLLADYCKDVGATHIIRGIRNNKDFNYEQELYCYNKMIDSSVETIYFMPDKEFENISSSFIRELQKYGKDVSEYLV